MIDWFLNASPIAQAVLAGAFTWVTTIIAASLVFFTRSISRTWLDIMLGFAAGVMIAVAVFSLLIPAVGLAEAGQYPAWLVLAAGVLIGAGFLRLVDATLPHLAPGADPDEAEGPASAWQRATLLVTAITIHNIPEGLAIGIAFGAAARTGNEAAIAAAIVLTIGISLQNMPEALAVCLPLRREGFSRLKSFWYGQLPASVEPPMALIGAAAVVFVEPLLPYALAFAAGAMLFVVIEELIPESQRAGDTDRVTLATIIGFAAMMALDIGIS